MLPPRFENFSMRAENTKGESKRDVASLINQFPLSLLNLSGEGDTGGEVQ
jgi:hypothetical protein